MSLDESGEVANIECSIIQLELVVRFLRFCQHYPHGLEC